MSPPFSDVPFALSEDMRRFIAENISSVEQLDILSFLQRNRQSEWPPDQIALRFGTSVDSAVVRLDGLVQRDLVKQSLTDPPHYSYAPKLPALGLQADALIHLYRTRRVDVITEVLRRPQEPTWKRR